MSSAQTSDGSGFQMEKMPRIESYLFRITDKVWDMAPFVGVYIFGLSFDITWLKYLVLVVGFISQPFVFFTLLRLLPYILKALNVILIELLLFRICTFAFHLLHTLIPNAIYVLNISVPKLKEESSWIDDPLLAVNPSRYSESQQMSNHMVYNSWGESWRDELGYRYQLGEGNDQCSGDQSHEGSEASEEEDFPDSENYHEIFEPKHQLERDMQYNGPTRQRSWYHRTSETTPNSTSEACSINNSADEYPKRQQKYGKQVSNNEGSKPAHSKQKRHSLPHSQSPLPSKPNITRHSTHIGPQGTPGKVPSYMQPTKSTLSQVKPSTKRDDSPKTVHRMPNESRETQMDKRRKSMNHVPLARDASSSPKTQRALSKSQESVFKSVPSPRDMSPRPESPRPRKRYNTCSEASSGSSEHPIKEVAFLSQKLHRKSTGTLGDTNTLQRLTVFAAPDDAIIENTETSLGDTYQPEMSEEEAMSLISDGHDSFIKTLATRKPIVDLMREQYINGNIQGALETAIHSADGAVIVNLFSAVMKKTDPLCLNLALTILPVVKDLINSEQEYFVVSACEMLRLILVKFKEVIKGNIHGKSSIGVDIAQEDRTAKSVRFHQMAGEMCDLLDDSHSLYVSMSKSFKELKLLISMLD